MANIIEYIKEEKRSFKELPFNDVDSLVLCGLSYFHIKEDFDISNESLKISNMDINKVYRITSNLLDKKYNETLFQEIRKSPRFKDLVIECFEENKDIVLETEFSAMTFLADDFAYVVFRGTEATLLGWKEDFNMAYMDSIPAQIEAANYLKKVMSKYKKKFYIGGHSKGGNLAIYAAMHQNIFKRNRIIEIFSHDGPGFRKKIYLSKKYNSIKNKISKTVPAASIIGMLLYSKEKPKIIDAVGIGFQEHGLFAWKVKDGSFIYLDKFSDDSIIINKSITSFLEKTSDEERKKFVTVLYQVLRTEEYNSLNKDETAKMKYIKSVKKNYDLLDDESKKILVSTLKEVFHTTKNNIDLKSILLKNIPFIK